MLVLSPVDQHVYDRAGAGAGVAVTCFFFFRGPGAGIVVSYIDTYIFVTPSELGELYQGESRCWNSSSLFFCFSCSVDQDGYIRVRAGAWISGNLFVFHAQSTRTVIIIRLSPDTGIVVSCVFFVVFCTPIDPGRASVVDGIVVACLFFRGPGV